MPKKDAASRQAAENRTEARKAKRRAKYDAREAANRAELAALGGEIRNKSFVREVQYRDPKSGLMKYKPQEITKRESPSEALARTKREGGRK